METQTQKPRFSDFEQVSGTTDATACILQQRANHTQSMKLLGDAGLRPYTRQEILPLLMKDKKLKNALKGKGFYLSDAGIDKDGVFTVDEKGELKEIEKEEISVEQKVCVWSGKNPLSLDVNSDDYASKYGGRFLLFADNEPGDAAPVVVGTPNGREAAAPKTDSVADIVSAELEKVRQARTEIADKQTALAVEDKKLKGKENDLKGKLREAEIIEEYAEQAEKLTKYVEIRREALAEALRST